MIMTKRNGYIVGLLSILLVAFVATYILVKDDNQNRTIEAHATYIEDVEDDFTLLGESDVAFFGVPTANLGSDPILNANGDCVIPRTKYRIDPGYQHKGNVNTTATYIYQEGGQSCDDPNVTEVVNGTPRLELGKQYMFFGINVDTNTYNLTAQPQGMIPTTDESGIDIRENLKTRFTFRSAYTEEFDAANPSRTEIGEPATGNDCVVPEGGTVPC